MAENRWLDPRCSLLDIPSNIDGNFIELGDGRLMSMVGNRQAFGTPIEGISVSDDDGKTWSTPRPVHEGAASGPPACGVLIRTREGVCIAVYAGREGFFWDWDEESGEAAANVRADVWSARSLDEGKTWTDHHRILDGYCGGLMNIIQTSSGTVVVPVPIFLRDPDRHESSVYTTVDQGVTWTRSNIVDLGDHGHHGGVDEGAIEEMEDGKLLMLMRTNWDQLWEAVSGDDGRSWRTVRPSGLDASSAPANLLRLNSGKLLLLWNRLYPEGKHEFFRSGGAAAAVAASRHREELSLAFSDDGLSWSEPQVIARDPGGLSYPRAFERRPGEVWITTAFQGNLQMRIDVDDFIVA